jgi:hypothetical protein
MHFAAAENHPQNLSVWVRTLPFITEGTESARRKKYPQTKPFEYDGPGLILTDQENLCAYARFCHKKARDVWNLTMESDDETYKQEAIDAAKMCFRQAD